MSVSENVAARELSPREELIEWTAQAIRAQALHAAAELGVADHLAEGPRNAAELASAVGADEDFLYRILRALAAHGVFEELPDKHFALNERAQYLRSGAEGSCRAWLRMRGQPWVWRPWGAIVDAVRSGRPAFGLTMGMGAFEYLPKNPEASAIFDEAMGSVSGGKFDAVAEAYDFGAAGTVVDVGGGAGGQLMAIVQRYPAVRGVVADLPSVVEPAKKRIAEAGLTDKIRCEAIDMFESVPAGGDVYLMGHILHDWDDERSILILKNCVAAMNEGGRVAVAEHLVPEPNVEDHALIADLEMLVMTEGGRERRLGEFDALFEAAGLRRSRVFETGMPWRVIEAVRR